MIIENTIKNITEKTNTKVHTANGVTFVYTNEHCIIALNGKLYIGDNNAEFEKLPNGKVRMHLHPHQVSEAEAIAFLNA